MFDLEFLLQYKYGSSSSHYHQHYSLDGNVQHMGTDLLKCNYDFFIEKLKKKAFDNPQLMNGVISTRLNESYEYLGNFVLAFDCDGVEEKNKAICSLNQIVFVPYTTFKYNTIISSCIDNKLHFWITTNYVASINICIDMMKHINGIDKNYIRFCEMRQNIVLRGFPKNGQLPMFLNNSLDSPDANKWFIEFRKYWQSEDVEIIRQNYFKHFDNTLKFNKNMEENIVSEEVKSPIYKRNFGLIDI
jgi:hypothetical protein